MIASEQELLLVEQHTMPLRMPRRGDDQKVRAGWHGLGTVEDDFGIWLGGKFGAVGAYVGITKNLGPAWYPILLALSGLPCCWLGGAWYLRRAARS